MTYADTVAAEIAARYDVPVMPGAFQRIPRGVSGLPDPLAPVPLDVSRKRYMAQHYAGNSNRARTARLRRADEAAEAAQAAKGPKPVPLTPEERAARDKARKADARHAAAAATEAKLRAMEGQPVEVVAAALGFTVAGTRKLATQKGVRLTIAKIAPRQVKPRVSAYKQRRMEREATIREAAKALPSISAVSRATGMKYATVQRVMAELGLACGGTRLYEERDREIYREWRNGNSYRALEARYGLAKSNIHRIVMREKSLDAP